MKILLVHNAYLHSGGEDTVLAAEEQLLRAHGHDVRVYRRHNAELVRGSRLAAARQAFWNRAAAQAIDALCADFRPDLVHAHNTFPLVSPAFFGAVKARGIALVQTLHNFRLLCPQGTLLRDGRVCRDCVGQLPWRAVLHGCYRGARATSAVAAGALFLHRLLGSHVRHVDAFIVTARFARELFVEGGLPAARLHLKPHFLNAPAPAHAARSDGLFAGRLSEEKGLSTLLAALEQSSALVSAAGDGPMAAEVHARLRGRYLGRLAPATLQARLQRAAYLVAPSLCMETFGMNVIEAFAAATPVIASAHGAYAELVQEGRTGLLFEPGSASALAQALLWAEAHPAHMRRMGANARAEYEDKYGPERNYRLLMEIYHHALQRRHAAA